MEDLRDIPYGYQMVWKTPVEVETRRPADCKGKAVAFYHRMQAYGAKNVRLVIGKRAPTSRMTHAWLVWETERGAYVLDPTFNWTASRTEQIGRRSYVPLYAYAGAKKFRAASAEGFCEELVVEEPLGVGSKLRPRVGSGPQMGSKRWCRKFSGADEFFYCKRKAESYHLFL